MKNQNKKGFTIVELVIVIAVIAILAAVLIPTFVGLVNKANLSADKQAVSQINKQLAMITEDKPESLADVILALRKAGVDLEDYKALTVDHYFYWVKSENQVILADKENTVVFPENSNITYTAGNWSSLSGAVVTDDSWTVAENVATINSGAQLVDFMQAHNAGESVATGVNEIVLTGTIDMMSADVALYKVTGDFKISGDATLMNTRSEDAVYVNEWNDADYNYGIGGLFGSIGKAGAAKVTVEGITIDGASIGDVKKGELLNKHAGVIAGSVLNGSKLTIKNVTVKNSTVISMDKTGALVGYADADSAIVIDGVTVENTKVIGHHYTAKLVGGTAKKATITLEGNGVVKADVTVSHIADDILPEAASPVSYTHTDGNVYYSNNNHAYYMAGVTNDYWWIGGGAYDSTLADVNVYVQVSASASIADGAVVTE